MVDVNQRLSYTIREKIHGDQQSAVLSTDDLPAVSLSVGVAFTDPHANPARTSSKDADQALPVPCQAEQQAAALLSARSFAQLRRLPDLLFRCAVRLQVIAGAGRTAGHGLPGLRAQEMRLQHSGARVCRRASTIFTPCGEAAAAYYYEDIVRTAVLRCKQGGCFGMPGAGGPCGRAGVRALPDKQPGKMPQYAGVTRAAAVQLHYFAGAARQPLPGMPGLPLLLSAPVGRGALGVPVETPLYIKRRGRPQKELTREQRLQNARGAFGYRPAQT